MSIPLQKNPKNTKTLRQELRASATPAEKLLWQYIKEKQIDNIDSEDNTVSDPIFLIFIVLLSGWE